MVDYSLIADSRFEGSCNAADPRMGNASIFVLAVKVPLPWPISLDTLLRF